MIQLEDIETFMNERMQKDLLSSVLLMVTDIVIETIKLGMGIFKQFNVYKDKEPYLSSDTNLIL